MERLTREKLMNMAPFLVGKDLEFTSNFVGFHRTRRGPITSFEFKQDLEIFVVTLAWCAIYKTDVGFHSPKWVLEIDKLLKLVISSDSQIQQDQDGVTHLLTKDEEYHIFPHHNISKPKQQQNLRRKS